MPSLVMAGLLFATVQAAQPDVTARAKAAIASLAAQWILRPGSGL